jgi:hypothetical protein
LSAREEEQVVKVKLHGASDPRAGNIDDEPEPLRAPDRHEPVWRYPNGERLSVRLLLAGQPAAQARRITELHAEAVAAIMHAAGEALGRGDHAELRRLAHGAALLCDELARVPVPAALRARPAAPGR